MIGKLLACVFEVQQVAPIRRLSRMSVVIESRCNPLLALKRLVESSLYNFAVFEVRRMRRGGFGEGDLCARVDPARPLAPRRLCQESSRHGVGQARGCRPDHLRLTCGC